MIQLPELFELPGRLLILTVSNEYKAISNYYGDRRANRSKVPLMNHINEGLVILSSISASHDTMLAFCIHPLCQDDENLEDFDPTQFSPYVVMLAMEYRRTANAYLSDVPIGTKLKLSPLDEVNDMLIADKVQNRKDFVKYHYGIHSRSERLDHYFDEWLKALDITENKYQHLIKLIGE